MRRFAPPLLFVIACHAEPPIHPDPAPPPSAGRLAPLAESEMPAESEPHANLDPAPPVEFPLPKAVTLVNVTDGEGTASFLWQAWFAGDPTAPELVARIEKSRDDGVHSSATEAAFELYFEDVRSAGYDTTSYNVVDAHGFDFSVLSDPPVGVTVRLRPPEPDEPYAPEVQVIEVLVTPFGG